MRALLLAAGVVACWGLVAGAQEKGFTPRPDAEQVPSYELVSVRVRAEDKGSVAPGIRNLPDGWSAGDVTLKDLIGEAYGFQLGQLPDAQLEGLPGWAKSLKFDVTAKVDASNVEKLKAIDKADTMMVAVKELATRMPSARMLMLQRMMTDRFALKVHYEQRVMPVYEMELAKGGLKLKTAHPKNPESGSMTMSNGKFSGENVPVSFIPAILQMVAERPVEDKTGAAGNYDFELRWSGEENAGDAGNVNAPTFFTALEEQMGLKLKAAKGPVWVVVVDHVEMPGEN